MSLSVVGVDNAFSPQAPTSEGVLVPDHQLSSFPVVAGESPQGTHASLGRENSIECLLRAETSDEGQTQSRKPAPLNITLCHEGFEIR